jgi:phosphoribulokinase
VVTPEVNIAQYPDLLIGVVPVINLEWIQKLWRDKHVRGYSTEAVTDTILRRMPDYVNYIVPAVQHTHVNFQRVPVVDTSNPFIARDIPSADESMVVIRFAKPKGIDFQYLLNMINDSWMSRANTIVVPGGKMELAMQLIFTPFIWRMMERKKRALGALWRVTPHWGARDGPDKPDGGRTTPPPTGRVLRGTRPPMANACACWPWTP